MSEQHSCSFDHLVGKRKQVAGYFDAERDTNSNLVGCNSYHALRDESIYIRG